MLAAPRALLLSLNDLFPVGMVAHGLRIGYVVIENRAVLGHPGQPLVGLQAGEVIHAALLQAMPDVDQLLLQLLVDFLFIPAGHDHHEQAGAQDGHHQAHQKAAAKDFSRHGAPPIL